MAKTKTQSKRRRQLSTVHRHAAGIDVGATFHVVAVPSDRDPEPCRTFAASQALSIGWLIGSRPSVSRQWPWMNVQLHHVICDITGVTGMRIIRAIIDPAELARFRDVRCKASVETIQAALTGNYRPEHVFALRQALELYDTYQAKLRDCDVEIEQVLEQLNAARPEPSTPLPAAPPRRSRSNELRFDARTALHTLVDIDLTQIHGLGPYTALRLVAECGDDMSRWPTAKHFTSWLTFSPGCRVSGGKVISAKTRRSASRAATLLRIAAINVAKTNTAIGAFYRRLAARIGKAKAVTATARKLAILFYNTLKHGVAYQDSGAHAYEKRYRQTVLGISAAGRESSAISSWRTLPNA